MEKLIIEPTLNSPRVVLDPAEKVFELSGESRPENVRNFYMPILEWLEKYAPECKGSCTFKFDFEYFNSTSAKYILDIFKVLNSIREKGSEIRVRWHYEADDEDMHEVGMEMSRMSGLKFDYVLEEV
jgi:hypothetical protein